MLIFTDRVKLHSGRGFNRITKDKCECGSGFFDNIMPAINFVKDNKDLLSNVGKAVGDVVTIGKNTKQIVDSIINKNENKNINFTPSESLAFEHKKVKDIIKRINKLNTTGSGFAMT